MSDLQKLERLVSLRRQFLSKRTDLDSLQKDAVDFELSYLTQVIRNTIESQETKHAG